MNAKKTVEMKSGFKKNARYYIIGGVILVLYVIFSFISKSFFSFNTLLNIFNQSVAIALASIGMTLIIISGGIDLSVGATIALSGSVAALAMQAMGSEGFDVGLLGILITLIIAVIIGLINGIMIGYLRASAFMVTLAMMSIARGLSLTISYSTRILVENSFFNFLASARIFNKIPTVLILLILIYICSELILHKTTFGRKVYAMGDNPIAAKASGIHLKFQTLITYMVAGIFVGLAAVIITGRARSAQPLAGTGMEFDVITAVVLGGTSLQGGRGNIKGTALGVILIAVISTGTGMLDITPFIDFIIKGILIILAVAINQYVVKRASIAVKEETKYVGLKNLQNVLHLITANKQQVLSLKNIYKTFPGVKALQDVSFDIKRGTVHALCGENGAGKSTLMKVLSGVYTKDSGEITVDGISVSIKSPVDSQRLGISVLYQELPWILELSVYQNVYLGNEITGRSKVILDSKKMINNVKKFLDRFNLEINVKHRINDFSVGQQQMIAMAKAISTHSWVVVMDEPTSAITEVEKEKLFGLIREIKALNMAVVYISHRISEIFEIADEVTVLRDGKHVVTALIDELDESKTIKYMVGRELNDIFYRRKIQLGQTVLEVKDLYRKGVFEPISFKVHEGEILGFSGLMGAGRTEVMRCIFGLDKPDGGEVYLYGKKLNIKSPIDAIKAGIAFISEDRRGEGIIPHMSVQNNISLASLSWINKLGWIDKKQETEMAKTYVDSLNIKTPSLDQLVKNLSGGNQQKVCIGKWLARKPKIVIMDEPTRGIDVGAKAEIHKLIDKLVKNNISILLISSEMPEIVGASDRIITMYKGKKTGELIVDDHLTQDIIMRNISDFNNHNAN